jgi:hypothetical protein
MNYQVSLEEYGDVKTYKLKESGENILVTNENRKEYVELYLDWILNTAIYEQFRAFYLGFHSVCASNALIVSTYNTVNTMRMVCPLTCFVYKHLLVSNAVLLFLIVFHLYLPFILVVCPLFMYIYIEIKHLQQFIKYCKRNCQLKMTMNELFINK